MKMVKSAGVYFNPTLNAEGTLEFQAHTVTKVNEQQES